MKHELIRQYLKHTVLFKNLSSQQLDTIIDNVTVRHVSEGDIVHRKGDTAETFYVVAVGEMELLMEGDDGINTIVGRVGPSGHFGETSLLTNKPQSLTIRSLCDSVLLCFTDRFFRRQLGEFRIVQEQIEAALAERLRLSFQNLSSGLQACDISTREEIRIVDMMPLNGDSDEADEAGSKERIMRSQSAKEIQSAIERFSSFDEPVLLTGESGTGRRLIAKQIHLQGNQAQGPYIEIDVRDFSADELAKNYLVRDTISFPSARSTRPAYSNSFAGGQW